MCCDDVFMNWLQMYFRYNNISMTRYEVDIDIAVYCG